MSTLDWAEREVELACKREAPNRNNGEWDYGCACYESALKAYKSLEEDGHSGYSWGVTKNILIRLLEGKPLSKITDADFDDSQVIIHAHPDFLKERGLKSHIQCPRMSSLFREETLDGKVTYSDVHRYYCYNIDTPDITYSGGGAATILDELFPITMPYWPETGYYKICCDEFLVDGTKGDFDTKAYLFIKTPSGEVVDVNRFFKEVNDGEPEPLGTKVDETGQECVSYYQPTKWVEISKEEYEERKRMRLH